MRDARFSGQRRRGDSSAGVFWPGALGVADSSFGDSHATARRVFIAGTANDICGRLVPAIRLRARGRDLLFPERTGDVGIGRADWRFTLLRLRLAGLDHC